MKKVAITCGDPAGVGPEIILWWVRENAHLAGRVVVIGGTQWLAQVKHEGGDLETIEAGDPSFVSYSGSPSIEGAKIAHESLVMAAQGCREGKFRAVVTGPVSKLWMRKAGFSFIGQTEFFAEQWGGSPTMGFCGEKLRVILATWHIPLAQVPAQLTRECLSRAAERSVSLAGLCGIEKPRIAICGLNPHAGEAGGLGREEMDFIDPELDRLRAGIPGLSSCLPADTVFWRALQGEFDVVVALYHDQGLAPLKAVDFEGAVNVTLGLPFVRTSPDHGTAFPIAGKGLANAKSFSRAVDLAFQFTA